ncbi:hypothetical protein ZEAMMB73_Zm00001d025436 [Zea mays]|uniref:Uncharacterized protein n=1 Tax=Zea mays TaxID=4577 RepID=A0A1D6J728_MAIZE|nr:hypothetical protein ZEAMMB73_Zm00001d025436 [Zea mays]
MPPDEPGERAVRDFSFHDMVIEMPRHDVRLWDLDGEGSATCSLPTRSVCGNSGSTLR